MALTGNEPINPTIDHNGYLFKDISGLTIRQHFASLAMQGYMSYEFAGHQDPKAVAKYAVECADALIAELNKESEVSNG